MYNRKLRWKVEHFVHVSSLVPSHQGVDEVPALLNGTHEPDVEHKHDEVNHVEHIEMCKINLVLDELKKRLHEFFFLILKVLKMKICQSFT